MHKSLRLRLTVALIGVFGVLMLARFSLGLAEDPPVDPAAIAATKAAAAAASRPSETESPSALATIAAYNERTEKSAQNRAAFVEAFNASGADPATLPRREDAVSARPAADSLEAATRAAALVAVVNVQAVRFVPNAAVVTLAIDDIAKGLVGVGQEVVAILPYYPSPDGADPSKTVLLIAPSTVPLFKGDRAIALLHQLEPGRSLSRSYGLDSSKPVYYPQPFSGIYRATQTGGLEFPEDHVPFRLDVAGKSLSDAFEAFRRAATK